MPAKTQAKFSEFKNKTKKKIKKNNNIFSTSVMFPLLQLAMEVVKGRDVAIITLSNAKEEKIVLK